ncbi:MULTISPECIES: hypothetical protein [Luteimonas]|jgi:hypothetical protein|uniref:hypothetical protein n=1 Tax=Luteimonas TaxID=83614 RepID=UPI000C7C72AD|nr:MULTISPECIES: hypothetical protein [Luteimonas]
MTISDDTSAILHDLDTSLHRYGTSEQDRLKKIAALANVAVVLRERAQTDERSDINRQLHALATKHGVPDECVLPQPD